MIAIPSIIEVRALLDSSPLKGKAWEQDEILSARGDIPIFESLISEGPDAVLKRLLSREPQSKAK